MSGFRKRINYFWNFKRLRGKVWVRDKTILLCLLHAEPEQITACVRAAQLW